jgi:hypothetical protein
MVNKYICHQDHSLIFVVIKGSYMDGVGISIKIL